MTQPFKPGDRVIWQHSSGRTESGTVEWVTDPMFVGLFYPYHVRLDSKELMLCLTRELRAEVLS